MIYFDRIEVVNYLVPAAGTPECPAEQKHLFTLPVQFLSCLDTLQHDHTHGPVLICFTFVFEVLFSAPQFTRSWRTSPQITTKL